MSPPFARSPLPVDVMSSTELQSRSSLGAGPLSAGLQSLPQVGVRGLFDTIAMIVFTASIFTSATLLFVVQPMVGKLLLPKLGGAPAVWNTCMLFFQATLLAGYLCAHLLTRYLPLRAQTTLYIAGLMVAWTRLPLSIDPGSVQALLNGADPNGWLLSVLVMRVAPVFFMLSITSPLLQNWFSKSGHPNAHDPYFLYSASNIGSILSLVLYPFVMELTWGVHEQTQNWTWGFTGFIGLAVLCGVVTIAGASRGIRTVASATESSSAPSLPITWARRGYWVLLSAIPSSLMLGVTTYVSTDVSSVPLIWIIPLTLYLLTFVFAFGRKQWISAYWMGRIASLLILVIAVTVVTGANDPPGVIIPIHLLTFGAVAMFCHQRLAADRPDSAHLTEFYLWMSIGGVVGGLCNALLAPVLLTTIFEYPLAMLLASMVRETRAEDEVHPYSRPKLAAFGVTLFAMVLGLDYCVTNYLTESTLTAVSRVLPLAAAQVKTLLCFGIPACLVLSQLERRAAFSVGLGAILLVSVWKKSTDDNVLERGRNFYGTIATARETLKGGEVVRMFHGNTIHGWQWTDEARRGVPLTYYGEHSGVGQLIQMRQAASAKPLRIGAVGLGAGSMAAWLRPVDTMIYYEINPQVVDHAERHFTYLSDARQRGATATVRVGDARLVLENELRNACEPKYDLLIVDAFSSDAIPVHLITDEACDIYRSMVAEDGVVAFHITNRFLNLEPVLAKLAEESKWSGYRYDYFKLDNGAAFDEKTGETVSSWVFLSANQQALGSLASDPCLRPLVGKPEQRIWTDDYSNLLSVFEWRF